MNPFLPGARRDRPRRGWTVTVLGGAPPVGRAPPNTLFAPASTAAASELLLRVSEPDQGRDVTGGVGLPAVELAGPAGRRVRGTSRACAAVDDRDRRLDRTVQRIPAAAWRAAVAVPGPAASPATTPAFDPPRWERFFNADFAATIFQEAAGNPRGTAGAAQDTGGFYSNGDTRYVLTHLSVGRRFGDMVVIRGRLPAFPRTREGAVRMGRGEVRFWSLCGNESRVTTRVADCLADRQVPLDPRRDYTIVAGRGTDRPRNARAACGIAWLHLPARGDAAGRAGYALLIMRNMLAAAGFRHAIQRITRFGDERRVMGPYLPRTTYASRAAVERLGCRSGPRRSATPSASG